MLLGVWPRIVGFPDKRQLSALSLDRAFHTPDEVPEKTGFAVTSSVYQAVTGAICGKYGLARLSFTMPISWVKALSDWSS